MQLKEDHRLRQQRGWTAFQLSDRVALERFEEVRDKLRPYEDSQRRSAAIQRFYDFAYAWY